MDYRLVQNCFLPVPQGRLRISQDAVLGEPGPHVNADKRSSKTNPILFEIHPGSVESTDCLHTKPLLSANDSPDVDTSLHQQMNMLPTPKSTLPPAALGWSSLEHRVLLIEDNAQIKGGMGKGTREREL